MREELIRTIFDKFLYTNINPVDIDLVDAYNYNNDVKYSCRELKSFPPWAQVDTIKQNLYGLKIEDILDRGPDIVERPFQSSAELDTIIEREKLEMEPPIDYTKSSILPD